MTSDAKIGLLLGLVFIFIIAFIINGLPNFRSDKKNNELTTNMVQSDPPPLATRNPRLDEILNRREPVKKQLFSDTENPTVKNEGIRFQDLLPNNTSAGKGTSPGKIPSDVGPTAPAPSTSTNKKIEDKKPRLVKPASPKIYVVVEGDNLAVIAKRIYGPEEGNKRINITRIFQANRKVLDSADEIYIGQKLIIPPLPTSESDENKTTESAFSTTIFEKVKSIGRRYLPGDSKSKWYVVREDDSLWKIAAEQLGNSSRYSEIARLNDDILDDEDYLNVGMRLRIPTQ